tara:strand:+ start:1016 stop:1873 length:858 start_codon:yes stop_codon:yes gene_type:complete
MSNFLPGLYIVSTPIGNLEDITLRALSVLKNSDQILCEDTRRSIKLLNHYNIKKKIVANHKFNEKKIVNTIIKLLNDGKVVSMISDAGTPILSDPGLVLIKECIKNNIKIIPIPGPSAITTAVSISGFDDKYLFYGFLPKKNKDIEKVCNKLTDIDFNLVFFIPVIKINFYTKYFVKFFKERNIFVARELTKAHETFYRGNLENFKGISKDLKGEITVVLSKKNIGININKEIILNQEQLKLDISKYLKRYTLKDVVKLISEKNNLSKKKVYELCLKLKKNEKNY